MAIFNSWQVLFQGEKEEGLVDISPKVYAHAISNSNWKGIYAVQKYETRVLVCSRRSGHNIFVFSEDPDPDYLAYRREYLGYGQEETVLVAKGEGEHLAERMINDRQLIEKLRQMVPPKTVIDTFTIGPFEERLAQMLNFRLIGNSENETLGSKSKFREIVKQAGYHVTPGFEYIRSVDEVIEAAGELFDSGAREIVVKGDFGASSAQNQVFSNVDDWKMQIKRFCEKIGFETGVVEEWVQEAEASPSTHYELNGNGYPEQQPGPWQQVLHGRNQIYKGAKYPAKISEDMAAKIREQGYEIACRYYQLGVLGSLGFDLIIKDGRIIWEEANLRKGGVTFIREFAKMQNVLDKIVWGLDLESTVLGRYTFGLILKKVKPLLFRSDSPDEKKEGIVFYNAGCLEEGKIQVIIVANAECDAQYFWEMLKIRLFSLPFR